MNDPRDEITIEAPSESSAPETTSEQVPDQQTAPEPAYKKYPNLRPFNTIPKEEAMKMYSNGGKKAQQNRKEKNAQKRQFQEAVKWLAEMPAFKTSNKQIEAIRELMPDLTVAEAMSIAVMAKTMQNGDPKGYQVIRDTSGDVPTMNVGLDTTEPMQIHIEVIE